MKYPDNDTATWQTVIDNLTLTLTEGDTPDKIISMAEMLVSGWPMYKIAKELGVSTKTARSWLVKYPEVTQAVAVARKQVSIWRMQQMEKQFVTAVKKSAEVLEVDATYDPQEDVPERVVNAKLLGIQAQHARWVLDLFLGNKFKDININIIEQNPTLKATKDALNYITEQLGSQGDDDIIEGTVRVVDEANAQGPLLDENGDPYYGALGILDSTDDGMLCHICGQRFKRLDIHLRVKEGVSADMYEVMFMLDAGTIRDAMREDDKSEEDRELSD